VKITDIKLHVLGRETEALAEVLRHFKPHLIGQDPLNRERIWQTLGAFWYEAPLPPDDVDGYAYLSQRLDIPLTVELLHKNQFAEYRQ
jgi:L-alanine-DL-glutamate epimerase-like enolase superfamily enzyme